MGLYSGLSDFYLPPNYFHKLRDMRPANQLVYFPQWEGAGAVSFDQYNAWNGAYVGVTLRQTGIGDGETCPLFDGANDFNNIWTANLQAAFDSGEGTCFVWARVFNAGVWTDGANRRIITLRVDVNNRVLITKRSVNNRLRWNYIAGGTNEQVELDGVSTTDWFTVALTWSKSAGATGEVIAYYNGAQTGVVQTGLGVWAGNLANTTTVVGAASTVPANVFDGYIAHPALFDAPLTPTEIAWLATTSSWRIP